MNNRFKLLIFGLCLGLLLALILFVNVGDKTVFTEGIDVSHHQGPIDWVAVKASGKAFVYMKATEGGDFVDPRFEANWEGARQAGMHVGAYHFFTLCKSAKAQAANFINIIDGQQGALPPALDLEHMGPCKLSETMRDPAPQALVFMDIVEAEIGVRPVIYTTREFHDKFLRGLTGETYWNRSLFIKPRFRESEWIFWQYSNRGTVKGIKGPVDLNKFRGDLSALDKLRIKE